MGVTRGSQGQQVPWFSSSLVSDFSFVGNRPGKVAATAHRAAHDRRPVPGRSSFRKWIRSFRMPSHPPTRSRPRRRLSRLIVIPPPATISAQETAAIQDLNRKLRANPKDTASLYRRGQLYARNNDFSRAIKDFDEMIRLNPKDAEALNNRCWVRAIIGRSACRVAGLRHLAADPAELRRQPRQPRFRQVENGPAAERHCRLRRSAATLRAKGVVALRPGYCKAADRQHRGGNNDIAAAKAIDPASCRRVQSIRRPLSRKLRVTTWRSRRF